MYKRILCVLYALLISALCACAPEKDASVPQQTQAADATPATETSPASETVHTEVEEPKPVMLNKDTADLGIQSGNYALRNRRGEYFRARPSVHHLSELPYLFCLLFFLLLHHRLKPY